MWILEVRINKTIDEFFFSFIEDAQRALTAVRQDGADGYIYLDKDLK